MLRILIVAVMVMMTPPVNLAVAGDFGGCDGCYPGDFPPHWVPRVHKFRPLPRHGVPFVQNLRLYPEGYHGVGCIWSRRRHSSDCVSY